MKNYSVNSIRIAFENWFYEERFSELLTLLRRHHGEMTQVSLFTTSVHSPLPPEELKARTDIMKDRLSVLKNAGYSSGINHLTTIGHHNEDLENCLHGDYHNMTNINGEVCRGSFCMNDTGFIEEYVVPSYRLLASLKPDHIWIDDDLRYAHMPIGNGCFCDCCMEKFNHKNKTAYTRETLRSAFIEDIELRKHWLKHNSETIANLLSVIGKAVREVSPDTVLGFMTCGGFTEGYDFKGCADALSENGKYEIMWRPGGGVYEDRCIYDAAEKARSVGRQISQLPEYVKNIQYELESFPYQLIKKTPKSTVAEAVMSMTVGCSGTAFNILPSETMEPITNAEPFLKAISTEASFFRLLSQKLDGLRPCGIHTGWRGDSQAAVPGEDWTQGSGEMYAGYGGELFSFGLPEAYSAENATVFTLTGSGTAVMSDAETEKLLSGGVYMDASALDFLNRRGFSELTGFTVGRIVPVDAREHYLPCVLNDGIAGGIRNCRQAFNPGDSFEITPQSGNCEAISELVDYHGKALCRCTTGIFENRLGGRICVSGYYPYSWVSDFRKTIQLKRIFGWLSHNTLPSCVDSYHRVRNITLTGNGRCAVTLFNISNDISENITVSVKTRKNTAVMYDRSCRATTLSASGSGEYKSITVKGILPYETVMIEV